MLISLFTDASFCDFRKIGAWAARAKANGETMRASGVLLNAPHSTLAELQAIVNGVYVACKRFSISRGDKFLIASDCTTAMDWLDFKVAAKSKNIRAAVLAAQAKFTGLRMAYNFAYEFRHVRAHQGAISPRNAVNEWCDREAKRQLAAARLTFDATQKELENAATH